MFRGRALQDARSRDVTASAEANITVVITVDQLQAAVMAGVRDIQIRAHLDLSDMPPAYHAYTVTAFASVLGDIYPSTRSIQVRMLRFVRISNKPPAGISRLI